MFASRFSSSIQQEPVTQPEPQPEETKPEEQPAPQPEAIPEPDRKVELKVARFEQYDNKGFVVGLVHEQSKKYFETLILFEKDFEAQDYLNKALEEMKPNIDALKNSLKDNVINIPRSVTV